MAKRKDKKCEECGYYGCASCPDIVAIKKRLAEATKLIEEMQPYVDSPQTGTLWIMVETWLKKERG